MKLKGSITISRPSYGSGEKWIEINIIDKTSWCEFLEVKMTLEEFACVLTGLGHAECLLDFREKMPIGKRREHKTEIVPQPKESYLIKSQERAAYARKHLAAFEVDGWKGHVDDLFNHHNWRGTDKVAVSFTRHVDVKEGESEKAS